MALEMVPSATNVLDGEVSQGKVSQGTAGHTQGSVIEHLHIVWGRLAE